LKSLETTAILKSVKSHRIIAFSLLSKWIAFCRSHM
jgi:hypothetical protein